MDRIVITIRPKSSDEGLLRVTDAMQQVLDAIRLFDEAERSLGSPHETFEWRLQRASTSSPFTVIAVAEPLDPAVNISPHVREVKSAVSHGLQDLVRGFPPSWMSADAAKVISNVFMRTINGIGETDIDFDDGEVIAIDPVKADAGLRTIAAINVLDLEADIAEREAFGEIEGVMVAAGRYRNRPAIQIRSELYGFVWCTLSKEAVRRFGSEHTMAEVWEGRVIGVQGRLSYGPGGRLKHIEVHDIREIESASPIDLDSVLDPDFTAGMDPHEYLRKFHEGELA